MEMDHASVINCVYDFSDYQKIYDLTAADLSKSILDCSSAHSHFSVEANQKGFHVQSANPHELPDFRYKTHEFDLALCTDFIFHHALSQHAIETAVIALCRVASEVRIFPLLDHHGKISKALGPLMLMLQKKNYGVEVREVPYSLLQRGNAMLRIWEQACHL